MNFYVVYKNVCLKFLQSFLENWKLQILGSFSVFCHILLYFQSSIFKTVDVDAGNQNSFNIGIGELPFYSADEKKYLHAPNMEWLVLNVETSLIMMQIFLAKFDFAPT